MNLNVLAGSGFGKSWITQVLIELNLDVYDRVLVLDYCDEYRGLCSNEHGPAPANHWIAGPKERDEWGPAHYAALLEENPVLDLARHQEAITNEDWREMCADAITGARSTDGSLLIVIDEAHFVAPQRVGYPDEIERVATTGRGSKVSAMWVSQRPAALDEQVIGNSTARFAGGFNSGTDMGKLADVVNYPTDVHKTNTGRVPGLPEALHTDDGEPLAVRKWEDVDEAGNRRVTASEWIYSDDSGALDRKHSSQYDPACEHVGAAGKDIRVG
ncbi:hypothetical protein [Halorarius litoreus]|uniref:hypothetical protein n=1 Tax=Halorarius litoreus TaxID=2962676 RepID=UPI0020CC09E8|nr:hypothetical protein [Halorarius litoreus]